jgi:hypothetical protein
LHYGPANSIYLKGSCQMHAVLRSLLLLFLISFAIPVEAGPIAVGDMARLADRPGTTRGGEFLMTVNDLESYITFCLQQNELIDFSTTFFVGGISTYASSDPPSRGGDAQGHDPLSPQTSWLYTLFRCGRLTGYDYLGSTRGQSADALQNSIWWFEGELNKEPKSPFVTAADLAVAGGWTGLGQVRALNLYFPNGREAQDQLVLLPISVQDVVPSVPEPTSLVLLGTSLMFAARRLRSRRRTAR